MFKPGTEVTASLVCRWHCNAQPWRLAGLWNTWRAQESGELVECHMMLTLNAEAHPLMNRMHKPDPKLSPTEQDQRSVNAIEPAGWDTWLCAPMADAQALIRLPPGGTFDAAPKDFA